MLSIRLLQPLPLIEDLKLYTGITTVLDVQIKKQRGENIVIATGSIEIFYITSYEPTCYAMAMRYALCHTLAMRYKLC